MGNKYYRIDEVDLFFGLPSSCWDHCFFLRYGLVGEYQHQPVIVLVAFRCRGLD